MQLNASLEYIDSFLPVEVVITDEVGHTPFEILQSVLMMTTVTASLLVKVPIFSQLPNIIGICSIVWSYRGT